MQQYQQRVVEERAELEERRAKLRLFCSQIGGVFDSLPTEEKQRLTEQEGHMAAYSDVLRRRIAAFMIGDCVTPTEKNDSNHSGQGVSLRDRAAMHFMAAFLAGAELPPGFNATPHLDFAATRAWEAADALLRKRDANAQSAPA